jgi:hypothetical protein
MPVNELRRWDWGESLGYLPNALRKIPLTFDAIDYFFQSRGGLADVSIARHMTASVVIDTDARIVTYRGDHIVTLNRDDSVVLGDPPRTRAAFDRINAFLHTFNLDCHIEHGLMYFYGRTSPREASAARNHEPLDAPPTIFSIARQYSFVMPARTGMRSDFLPLDAEQLLHVGCRLGYREPADMLAMSLRERGETVMAEAVLENKGRAFGCRGMRNLMQELFDVVWRTSDGGEWLVDLQTGKLVRPLMALEVGMMRIRTANAAVPATTTMPDGVTYGVTIGTEHVARDKNYPRRVELKTSKTSIATTFTPSIED